MVGILVSGRVIAPNDRTNLACFVTMVEPKRQPRLLLTLGGDMYLVQRCDGPKAVGLVATPSAAGNLQIGLVYGSNLPGHNEDGSVINPDGSETFIPIVVPLVVEWNEETHRLTIDKSSTDKAGNAETLPALLKALR